MNCPYCFLFLGKQAFRSSTAGTGSGTDHFKLMHGVYGVSAMQPWKRGVPAMHDKRMLNFPAATRTDQKRLGVPKRGIGLSGRERGLNPHYDYIEEVVATYTNRIA